MFADSGTGLGLGGLGGFGWGLGGPGGFGGGLGSGSTGQDYIHRPELKMLVPPIYPKDAEERKVEGNVELHIHITTMGTVDQVLVIKSSG